VYLDDSSAMISDRAELGALSFTKVPRNRLEKRCRPKVRTRSAHWLMQRAGSPEERLRKSPGQIACQQLIRLTA
jgi:hypothetical protein